MTAHHEQCCWRGALHIGQLLTHSKTADCRGIVSSPGPAPMWSQCHQGGETQSMTSGSGDTRTDLCCTPPPHTHISQASPSPLLCSFVGSLYLFITQTKRQSLQENNIPRHWSPSLWDLTASTEAGSPTLSFGWERALVHQGVCSMLRIKGRRDNEVEQKTELESRGLCCVCVVGG